MMNNNTNSLIGNQFSEQELQNGSLNGSCEDYNGSTGVWRISENEKLHEILHNRCFEQRYVYTVQKSGGSLNPAAVLSGAVLFLCAFLPFVSVNMYFYKQEVNLIDMRGGWLILVCGIAGILGGLSKNTSIQFYSGISSMLSLLFIYYYFADGGNEFARAASQVLLQKESGFYTSIAAAVFLTFSPIFNGEDRETMG